MEKPSTEENQEEKYSIIILSELFNINHKHGQSRNLDKQNLSTDKSIDTASTTNRALTKKLHRGRNSFATLNQKISRFNDLKQLNQLVRAIISMAKIFII